MTKVSVVCLLACVAAIPASALLRNRTEGRPQRKQEIAGRNVFGIGLVSEGNQEQWNYAHDLAGDGGWVLLTFAGVDNTTTGPQQSWVEAVAGVQKLNLNPVLRLSPPWGAGHYRAESDDADHRVYTTLAAACVLLFAHWKVTCAERRCCGSVCADCSLVAFVQFIHFPARTHAARCSNCAAINQQV